MSAEPISMLEAGSLPVEDLAAIAAREGRRPRPVYGSHKWFARRLGSAFRSLLVAAALPADGDFWDAFEDGLDLGGLVVLDPFIGGGTSSIEAQRLGARVIGTDVDPVAAAIAGFQARLHQLPSLKEALTQVTASVGQTMSRYFTREDGRLVLHHFWVQRVDCACCGHGFDAHPNHILAHEKGAKTKHAFCQHCDDVHAIRAGWQSFTCKACRRRTHVNAGAVVYGTARCPRCDHAERLIDIGLRTGKPPVFRLFAVETIPTLHDPGRAVPMSGRLFHKASPEDHARARRASQALAMLQADGGPRLPTRRIPEERSDARLLRYGYRDYADLFSDRQKLHLLLLSRAIQKIQNETIRTGLSIAFSDHLKANCLLASYAVGYRRLSPLFALRAFRHVPRPVELNPWVEGTGRGTFPNAVRSVERAAAWSRRPVEYARSGGFHLPLRETANKLSADIRRCSAESLVHVADASVDLVITDPPYFDNIAYSELADFFVPWAARLGLLHEPHPGFPPEQLAATGRTPEAARAFGGRLRACFVEIARTMKPSALAAFTYQHSTAQAWEMLAEALSGAPLEVVNVFPLAGDSGSNLHRHEESITWDAVLVLRRREGVIESVALQVNRDEFHGCRNAIVRWRRRLAQVADMPFRESDARNLLRAVLVAKALGPARSVNDPLDLKLALANFAAPPDRLMTRTRRLKATSRCSQPDEVRAFHNSMAVP